MRTREAVISVFLVSFIVGFSAAAFVKQTKKEEKLAAKGVSCPQKPVPVKQGWQRVDGNADLYYFYDQTHNSVCYTKNPFNDSPLTCL